LLYKNFIFILLEISTTTLPLHFFFAIQRRTLRLKILDVKRTQRIIQKLNARTDYTLAVFSKESSLVSALR